MPVTRSTNARGYGATHKAIRRRYARVVAQGDALCCRCGQVIAPDQPWDLDHADDRRTYLGVAHRSCNRSVGGRNGATVTNAKQQVQRWDW